MAHIFVAFEPNSNSVDFTFRKKVIITPNEAVKNELIFSFLVKNDKEQKQKIAAIADADGTIIFLEMARLDSYQKLPKLEKKSSFPNSKAISLIILSSAEFL